MHELPVVHSLVEQLHAEAERLGVKGNVAVVHLKLGALTTFVPEAMMFYFEALKTGTDLESARLDIEEVPVSGTCRRCGEAVTLEGLPFVCAACGSPDLDITSGRELLIDCLEVKDGDAA